jgi:hypothetical protein
MSVDIYYQKAIYLVMVNSSRNEKYLCEKVLNKIRFSFAYYAPIHAKT